MYSVLETYPASGRPTGQTLFEGTENECLDYVETNFLQSKQYRIVKGSLEDATETDERGWLQWK